MANVKLVADFRALSIQGAIDKFRSFDGTSFDDLSLTLGSTRFSQNGDAFNGKTTAGIPGVGTWGARWSDGEGRAIGGTFGFAADDRSIAILGAFSACACESGTDGDPDDAIATSAQ